MEDKRGPGRPATGQTAKRNVRIGPLWDRAAELAAARGINMTAFVEEALRREVARIERQDMRDAG